MSYIPLIPTVLLAVVAFLLLVAKLRAPLLKYLPETTDSTDTQLSKLGATRTKHFQVNGAWFTKTTHVDQDGNVFSRTVRL